MNPTDPMRQAIALSARALDEAGTEPFGAVVVKDGVIVGAGFNHAAARFDPTAHGEVEAIRDACRRLRTLSLDGCELYTSCEPCALCVAAMHIVGIRRLFYAATLQQSDAALAGLDPGRRPPIDVDALRAAAGATLAARQPPAVQRLADEAVAVLQSWAAAQREPPARA